MARGLRVARLGLGTILGVSMLLGTSGPTSAATYLSWIPALAPVPAGGGSVSDTLALSCADAGDCVAVGSYPTATGQGSFADTLAGGTWTATALPQPDSAALTDLDAVSCVTADECVAVGSVRDAAGTFGLIDTLSGGTWTASIAPLAPNPISPAEEAYFTSVACPDADDCVALGEAINPDNALDAQVFTDTEQSGTWTVADGLIPADLSDTSGDTWVTDSWAGLSCSGVGSCEAVGTVSTPITCDLNCGTEEPFADALSAGTWTTTDVAPPSDASTSRADTDPTALSCASDGSCVAVGSYIDASGDFEPLVATLSDGTWSSQGSPDDSATSSGLSAVSCAAAGSCVGVGSVRTAVGVEPGIDTDDGGSWTWQIGPLPADSASSASGQLTSVTCVGGVASCIAAGSYVAADQSGSLFSTPLVETLAGGAWTATELPVPNQQLGADLSAISCPTVSTCAVIGGAERESAEPSPLTTGLLETMATSPTLTTVSYTDLVVQPPSPYGQALTLTAIVAPTDGGGAVDFTAGDGPIAGCTDEPLAVVNGVDEAICTTSSLAPGTQSISVIYSGDASVAGSTDAAQQVVTPAAQSVSFTSRPPSPALLAGPVYELAATGGASGNPVDFSSATTSVCTVAGAEVTFVDVGTCTIDAEQAGDVDYAPGSATQTFVVTASPTEVTMEPAGTRSYSAEGATALSFHVVATSGGTPSGIVSIQSESTLLCAAAVSPSGAGSCHLAATQLVPGRYSVQATFFPSSDVDLGSQSSPEALVVDRAPTGLMAVPGRQVATEHGWRVTLSAALQDTATGRRIAGARVSFQLGSSSHRCTAITSTSGVATCTIRGADAPPGHGYRTYTATFSGTANYRASRSASSVRS